MHEMLLDREGTARIPDGYILVDTEVDFLKYATNNVPLVIRGEGLCNWAELFFKGREIPSYSTRSFVREICSLCPHLSDDQAKQVSSLLGEKLDTLPKPLTVEDLLNTQYPCPMWKDNSSISHLAEWLVWLYLNQIDECMVPLLKQKSETWFINPNDFDASGYKIISSEEAHNALCNWLGIGEREDFPLIEEFPLEIPLELEDEARDVWEQKIIEGKGQYFQVIHEMAVPFSLKQIGAREAYEYYIKHVDFLSSSKIVDLAQYLSRGETEDLYRLLPPLPPRKCPDTPEAVLAWFKKEYLPYREWQHSTGSQDGLDIIKFAARDFAQWYLTQYPRALAGAPMQEWISFNKIRNLDRVEESIILIIVLDGLHLPDARSLLQSIQAKTHRLSIIADDLVFAPIPTVTQFAKDSLFKGVPPNKTQLVDPVATILPEDKSPAHKLATSHAGRTYLWRVLEPDRTYHHKNTSENLRQDIEGRLEAEALKIKEIIEELPSKLLLQIIIATDHGRLLSLSEKRIPVPPGLTSHGRAAWGEILKIFPESGFFVEDDIAYLYGDSYGMSEDIAIPLDESSFKGDDNRGGRELYPHGGLFPEEVIIPWIVLARDVVRPKLNITITGRGTARKSGSLSIKIMNMSDLQLVVEDLSIRLKNGPEMRKPLGINVGARSEEIISTIYEPWPSASEIESTNATVCIRQQNLLTFNCRAEANLQSDDMYTRPKDILEDML
jgi:hypothetical protein